MTISVTKPSINLREKLNELDQPQGLKGTELLRANTAQEVRNAIGAGRKNLIINGGFDVWQRGTSFSVSSSSQYTADRWTTWGGTSNSVSITQSSIGARITSTSYNGTNLIEHRIEGTYVAGKEVTLSVKTGSVCSNASMMLYTRTSAGTWQHTPISASLSANTINTDTATIPADAGKIHIRIYNASSSGALDVDVEYVQLELGSTATDFEHRSYGEELALCQRYYWQMPEDNTMAQLIMTGLNSGAAQISFFPPVPFRIKPTIGVTDTTPYWESYPWYTVGTTMTISSISNGHFNRYGGEFVINATFSPTLTRGINYNVNAEVFTFNAEL